MDRRTKLASVIAVTAVLLTGGMAAAATTRALSTAAATGAGHVQLIQDGAPSGAVAPAAAPTGGRSMVFLGGSAWRPPTSR